MASPGTISNHDLTRIGVVRDIIYGKMDGVTHENSKHFTEQLASRGINGRWLDSHFAAGHVNDDSRHGRGRWKVCSPYGFTSHNVGYERRGKGHKSRVMLVHIFCTVTKSRRDRYMVGKYADGGAAAGGGGGGGVTRKKKIPDDEGWTTV